MEFIVGDIVKFKDTGTKGEIGRISKTNGRHVWVHFQSTGCLRIGKDDVEPTKGKAPDCNGECASLH